MGQGFFPANLSHNFVVKKNFFQLKDTLQAEKYRNTYVCTSL